MLMSIVRPLFTLFVVLGFALAAGSFIHHNVVNGRVETMHTATGKVVIKYQGDSWDTMDRYDTEGRLVTHCYHRGDAIVTVQNQDDGSTEISAIK